MPLSNAVASLPMYDLPALRAATDRLWQGIRDALTARGIPAPAALDRREDFTAVWHDPHLLLSQTCGYPYATTLRGRVQLVAIPIYGAPGCQGGRYRSVLVVRREDKAPDLSALRGRRAAFNARDSQSGMNALRAAVAPLAEAGRFFADVVETGSHRASALAVQRGEADIAAIDCVTWALLDRHEPETVRGLRVLGHSPDAPALPYVTAAARPAAEVAVIREALCAAVRDPDLAPSCATLLLEGFAPPDEAAYDEITRMEAAAIREGYPRLA